MPHIALIRLGFATVVGLATLLTCPFPAQAQTAPGIRASGMAGAFVAVADDASAVYWNPAGLVFGPVANAQADLTRDSEAPDAADAASRTSSRFVAAALWPLGVSYYRLGQAAVQTPPPAGSEPVGRQREGGDLYRLATTHVGVTVLQSIGEWLTLGATGKIVRGGSADLLLPLDGRAISGDRALDRAQRLDVDASTRGDLDVGAMVEAGRFRAGLLVRNLTEPSFGGDRENGTRLELARSARLGVAWGSGWPARARVVVAADADVTRRVDPSGSRRDVSSGVETWWADGRFGLRSGVRLSTLGDRRPVGAVGASIRATSVLFLDARGAVGAADDRGWGVGVRVTF